MDWFLLTEFVTNNQVSEIIRFSLFFVNYSFYLYLDIESVKSNLSIWSVNQKREVLNIYIMADRMERILDIIKALLTKVKEKYEI